MVTARRLLLQTAAALLTILTLALFALGWFKTMSPIQARQYQTNAELLAANAADWQRQRQTQDALLQSLKFYDAPNRPRDEQFDRFAALARRSETTLAVLLVQAQHLTQQQHDLTHQVQHLRRKFWWAAAVSLAGALLCGGLSLLRSERETDVQSGRRAERSAIQ